MNLSSNKVQTAANIVTGMLAVVIQFAVSFFLSPFIVRMLGAEANGFSQLAGNFVMYATLITTAFNSMAGRCVSVAYHKGELEKAHQYYSSIFMVNIICVVIMLPLALYVVLNLENLVVVENVDLLDLRLLFACIFLNFFIGLITSPYSMAMFVRNQVFYGNVLGVIRVVLNAVLLLILFSVLPIKIFYISLVSIALTVGLCPIVIKIHRKLLPDFKLNYREFSFLRVKELFMSGIWNTFNQCGHLLNTGLDILLTNWFVSPFYMGVLAVSKTIPSAIIQLSTTLNSNFSPSVTMHWAQGDANVLLRELRVAMKISTIVVSVPIVTFCCFGNDFYQLWQPTLPAEELTILSFLGCMAFIPVAGTQTLYNVYTASNKLKVNSVSFFIMGLLNVAIVFVGLKFCPEYGTYIIAGCSSTLSIIRNMTVTLPYTAYLLKQKWYIFYKDVLSTLGYCLINAAVALFFIFTMHIEGWLGLILMGVLTVLITLLLDAYLLLNKNERTMLFKILRIKSNG